MRRYISALFPAGMLLLAPAAALAASNEEVGRFTSETLTGLIGVASLAAVFFLIRGAYLYITSTSNPAALEEAKRTIRKESVKEFARLERRQCLLRPKLQRLLIWTSIIMRESNAA